MSQNNPEELEGLDGDEDASWGDYPIDTMLIRNEPRTVHEVLRRIDKGQFVMDPEFQRDFMWSEDQQSKLIESVLMRIPLPVFYLAEDKLGRLIVVDGLQRLTTFRNFVNNKLKLKLPNRQELNKKQFRELSPKLQNRVEDCSLVLYVIDAKVPPKALLDIFDRVNSGVPLTRQQMRNCLFVGPATRFLRDEADTKLFKEATGGSIKSDTMRDREVINRFCAFKLLGVSAYKGDMDEYLAQALEKMNALPEIDIKALSTTLRKSLNNNITVFGRHAFRKFKEGNTGRSVFNVSIWDVMSSNMTRLPSDISDEKKEEIRAKFINLIDDTQFWESVTFGTNQANRVRYRFGAVEKMFSEIFDD
ncbi:MAG: DUF262 domain-containing protein [Alphaproteobacteria bacterium]